MKLKEIITIIEEEAPLMLQESYDNAGLLLGSGDKNIRKVLICLDVTEPVIDEAIDKGCNLIISHHPLIFKAIKRINPDAPVERILVRAIKHDIAIYAAHTNLDNVIGGVSGFVARKLGLMDVQILSPQKETLRKLVTFCPV
ncbi:MAG: Nif3-like dinuclear metal center hexameric protein, partial [Bacteroidales bacterium]|nr:Nif3-like dinuclear metal center hexameric protein [Bacteroidales bacterium]